MADEEAREAREGRADRLLAASAPEPQPAPEDAAAGSESAAGAPALGQLLPTLEDDLLSQALAMGPEQFSVPALCLAARTARAPRSFALKHAAQQLAVLGWQPNLLPTGLTGLDTLARFSAARVLEGLVVSVPAAEARLCRLLRAFGASVTHTQTADFSCSPVGYDAAAHKNASSTVVVPASALEVFVFSPFVSTCQSFKSGKDLSEKQIAEVLSGYAGYDATVADVRAWSPDESSGEVYWQDLALRTHRNVRTGDVIHEWNYGLGDNDFGSFHFQRAGLESKETSAVKSIKFAGNYDGDRTCHDHPDPPWFPGNEDSVAVQRAVHSLLHMPLYGSAFQGCCFTVPGRGETEWMQDWSLKPRRNLELWRRHLDILRKGTGGSEETWLHNLECMEDGLDEDVEWPAMPATAALLIAALNLQ